MTPLLTNGASLAVFITVSLVYPRIETLDISGLKTVKASLLRLALVHGSQSSMRQPT